MVLDAPPAGTAVGAEKSPHASVDECGRIINLQLADSADSSFHRRATCDIRVFGLRESAIRFASGFD